MDSILRRKFGGWTPAPDAGLPPCRSDRMILARRGCAFFNEQLEDLMAEESTQNPKHINPWIIAIAVMLSTFMEVLDTTVVNVSLPHIAGSLSATVEEATWTLTSYL